MNFHKHLPGAVKLFLLLVPAICEQAFCQAIDHVERQWINDTTITDSNLEVKLPCNLHSFEIEVCATMKGLKDKQGKNKQYWTVELLDGDSTVELISVSWGNNDMGNIGDYRYLEIAGNDFSTKFSKDVSLYSNDNYLVITASGPEKASVSIGSQYPRFAGEIKLGRNIDAIRINSYGTLEIGYISTYCPITISLDSSLDLKEISRLAIPTPGTPCGINT